MYDLEILNGVVFDPLSGELHSRNIYIKDGVFAEVPRESEVEAKRTIDAQGCYVSPGFVDSHIHVYNGSGSYDLNVPPDIACIPNCVTTCIDGGSSGPLNFEGFLKSNIAYSTTTIKATLHMYFNGIMPNGYDEDEDPEGFDLKKLRRLVYKYASEPIVGLKIRQHAASAGKYGVSPLFHTVRFAQEMEQIIGRPLRVTVHVTDIASDITMKDIVDLLRPGDVFTHPYSGIGRTILDDKGRLLDVIKEAQDRGVMFDSGFATSRLDIDVLTAAFQGGLYPDLIGTDTVGFNSYLKPMFSLPYQMSLLLAMGMSLKEVLKAVTITPSVNYGFTKDAGTLSTGAKADVAIFKVMKKKEKFTDLKGRYVEGNQLIVPMATIKEGKVVFMQIFM